MAHQIYTSLQERGVNAWYDALIEPGRNWRDAIVEKLQDARVMLILLSRRALHSEELKKELAVAKAAKVPLLAARLEQVELSGAFAYELEGLNWFDLFDHPDQRLAVLVDFLENLAKSPDGARAPTETSIHQFGSGRQPGLPWYKRILYQNYTLSGIFLAISAVQFLLYEMAASPVEQLTESGLGSLTAFLYVLVAVTIASPLLLLTVLLKGLTPGEIPLLVTASLNSAILVLLARNFFRWVYQNFNQQIRKK